MTIAVTEPFPAERAGVVRRRRPFSALLSEVAPLDLRLVGRTILHAVLVGAIAGLIAVLFFGALELVEELLLGRLAGYARLRAHGEAIFGGDGPEHRSVRLWLLLLIPALGALAGGILTWRVAPEAAGGGGDAMIQAFHHHGGRMRKRVAWVKALASILTLGSGGAGGREGPTMQVGGALGSLVGRGLAVGRREHRILMLAGVAAGMSAIFRTPLGAALLAVEVLYRDDFEAEALIPALLASVVSYSVFISFYGESTLFAHAPKYAFVPSHLPLYALLALLLAFVAIGFLKCLGGVKAIAARLPIAPWARPGLGGLALGLFCVPVLWFVGRRIESPGQGLGLLGGGYGAVQVAITGATWLHPGWRGVELLLLLCAAKIVASSLTLGSGGCAGDFAPSLVIGGLFGGAFGRAAALLLGDPRIDPGAFALVGMGTFYGGVAHVPVSSLVMVCELAGSYDLLVPLMLAEGVAFVALRKHSLYHAQLPTQRESPAHPMPTLDVLKTIRVRQIMIDGRALVTFAPGTPAREMLRRAADASWQEVFPVLEPSRKMVGMITAESLRIIAVEHDLERMTVAADAMQPPVAVTVTDDLRTATEAMVAHGVRELPVVDGEGAIVGFVDEADIGKAYLEATTRPARADETPIALG
ncbi:chloride channel protein [Sorangium cellulosum]|uniref:Chloride channel protein n=1 Tax=Sorangium cellulosum TaxID=56 RepID=A0A4P2QS62_SORCE|nr:chloride channel protein [Sorangium cellulosum]WCQ92445.1 H(+)/Cl(-) exchange transporter ClcA [Sorangium sp. Soce836]